VPAGDVGALATAMAEALACPRETLDRMGEAGRARVMERHSVETEAAKLAEHFRKAAVAGGSVRALDRAPA
jgi:glycosyltransferase involved in cell wall biosynthesis